MDQDEPSYFARLGRAHAVVAGPRPGASLTSSRCSHGNLLLAARSLSSEGVLAMQRAAGNHAVTRYLSSPTSARLLRNGDDEWKKAAQALSNRGGRVDPPGIEMMDLTVARSKTVIQTLNHFGTEVACPSFPSFRCWKVGRARILMQYQLLHPNHTWAVHTRRMVVKICTLGSTLYRGIPIWHKDFLAAYRDKRLVPFKAGSGEPGFVTSGTNYIPLSEQEGTAEHAAKAQSGGSQGAEGPRASIADVRGFNPNDPEQIVGVVAAISVRPDVDCEVAIVNADELQIRGPVKCTIHKVIRIKDLQAPAPRPPDQ